MEASVIQVTPNFRVRTKPKKRWAKRRPGMSDDYLAKIRRLPSCISGRTPCVAHHLRIKWERGIGMKATDQWAVPLTRDEHLGPNGVHTVGSRKEMEWFYERGVYCVELAESLWANRDSEEAMLKVLLKHIGRGR